MNDHPVIALVGALDTKGVEHAHAREVLRELGADALLIDTGVLSAPAVEADVGADVVAAAGGGDLASLRAAGDRGVAMKVMADGAATIVEDLRRAGRIHGVLALGGSNAAYVLSVVAARLPVGFPKLLVSTMAAGDTRGYVGETDLALLYPVVDINGLNRVSRRVIRNAAGAIAGMARAGAPPEADDRPVVAISMMGVTTAVAADVAARLEAADLETLSFHTTGAGGRTMESLIRAGLVAGVADLTTSELADELVGGICSAGPDRLTAAGLAGVPQVVSLGGLDMAKFGARDTVPERYRGRRLHEHNPQITLLRTDAAESAELGRRVAERLNRSTGRVLVIVPSRGVSQLDVEGMPFHDPVADAALVAALMTALAPHIEVRHLDTDINDPAVASMAADTLIAWTKDGTR